MARFTFELEALLTARRHAEQQRTLAVAAAERERLELEERLRRSQAFIEAGRDAQREHLVGALELPVLRGHASATIDHLRDAQRVVVELAGAYRRLESARAALATATAERRAIELLRERRFAEWKQTHEKRETAELDEIAGRMAFDPSRPFTPH